jgi:hypothetical protein
VSGAPAPIDAAALEFVNYLDATPAPAPVDTTAQPRAPDVDPAPEDPRAAARAAKIARLAAARGDG